MVVTPDGNRAVSTSIEGILKVWNLQIGQEERTLTGHSGSASVLAITPNGRYIISASSNRTLMIWDLQTGQEQALVALDGALECVAVAPDGVTILVGDVAGNVYCLRYLNPT